MRAGQLRHRISIQAPQETFDDAGAIVIAWSEIAAMWASVEPATGAERWVQNMDQRVAERAARIRLRYRDDVTINERCRVVWGSHTYDVLSVADQMGRERELVLTCSEVNADVA